MCFAGVGIERRRNQPATPPAQRTFFYFPSRVAYSKQVRGNDQSTIEYLSFPGHDMRLKLLLFVGATRAALATYHRSRSQASLDQCIDFAVIIVCIQVVARVSPSPDHRALMENLEHAWESLSTFMSYHLPIDSIY